MSHEQSLRIHNWTRTLLIALATTILAMSNWALKRRVQEIVHDDVGDIRQIIREELKAYVTHAEFETYRSDHKDWSTVRADEIVHRIDALELLMKENTSDMKTVVKNQVFVMATLEVLKQDVIKLKERHP